MQSAQHKRCLNCGYILDGLPESRCPECGRGFDPGDPATYLTKRESGRPFLALAFLGVVLMLIALTLAWLADHDMLAPISDWWVVIAWPLLLGGACLQFYVLVASVIAMRRPRGAREHPTCWLAALIISGLIVAGFVALLVCPSYW